MYTINDYYNSLISKDMQDLWKKFVYPLIDAKKKDLDEDSYHRIIEFQLQLLGWASYMGEICHKENIPIGNNNFIQPDILVKLNGEVQFVIEVKRPVHELTERERIQLESYMRQLKIEVGVYIGDHIEVIYDKPKSKNAITVLALPLNLEEKRGSQFVELFSKENFSRDEIIKFCEDRLVQIKKQADLNKIKKDLVSNANSIIVESLTTSLLDKYGESFSKDEIKKMLSTLKFNAFDEQQQDNLSKIHGDTETEKSITHTLDHTLYSLNGGEPLKKNRFVLEMVSTYVKQHPEATFSTLESIFKPELQGSFGVIRTLDFIKKKNFTGKRYFLKENEILHSSDNVLFAVSSEWGKDNIDNIEKIATKLGYTIKKYSKTTISEKKNKKIHKNGISQTDTAISCHITRNCDAHGIFDINERSLIVTKGSKINSVSLSNLKGKDLEKREKLIKENTTRIKGALIVDKDILFNTPSGAAVFCIGGAANGWIEWQDEKGNRLDIYRNK